MLLLPWKSHVPPVKAALPVITSRLFPSNWMVPVPLNTLPAARVTSRAGLLASTRNRPPLDTSSSPATVRLEGAAKFTNPAFSHNFPPAGTFTGTLTVASDPTPGLAGSANTSHNPRFSTRPLP